MKVAFAILIASLVCLTAAESPAVSLEEVKQVRHPAVKALPVFARLGQAPDTCFILRGRLSKNRAVNIERVVRYLQRDVKRRFLSNRDKTGLRPVDVCLFAETESYEQFARKVTGVDKYSRDRGFFVPYRRLVIVDLSGGPGSLRHELTHVLLQDDLGSMPFWLDEGIASLYASVETGKDGLKFLADHRLDQLRAARRSNELPSLEKLSSIDDREMYGPRYASYYALSRFLLLYLDRRGKLKTFMKTMLSGSRDRGRQLAVLKEFIDFEAFVKWTDRL